MLTLNQGTASPPIRTGRLLSTATALSSCEAGAGLVVVRVAVEALGARTGDAPDVAAGIAAAREAQARGVSVAVALDHAGPAAALWSSERPWGPDETVAESRTGRRPRALDEAGWARVTAAFAAAASAGQAAGVPVHLAIDDDGLLQATLSPRTNPAQAFPERLARVTSVFQAVRAVAPAGVLLTVDELCPGGLDATDGIAAAQALCAAGATVVFGSGGTAALPALWERKKGRTLDATMFVHAPRWLLSRVDVPVWAVAPRGEAATVSSTAEGLGPVVGLAGVLRRWEP